MPSVSVADLDDTFGLFDPDIFQDPYPTYHMLRHADPVHWCAPIQSWLLTRYDDASTVLSDRRFVSGRRRPAATNQLPEDLRQRMMPIDGFISLWLMNIDPPEHAKYRVPLNKLFSKSVVGQLAGKVAKLANELVDRMLAAGSCDFIEEFAQPLPVAVIASMVGIPRGDYPKLFAWFARMTDFFELGAARPAVLEGMTATVAEMHEYFDGLLERRLRVPEDDLLTRLVDLERGQNLSARARTRATLALLLFAGHESTRAMFGNGLLALLGSPAMMTHLRANLEQLDHAIEEMLRFDGPFMRLDRVASTAIEMRGRRISAGERLVLILGAANRDPARFPIPDVFDINRVDVNHLSFGYGEHFCLGARLARMELAIGFAILLNRLPNPQLAQPGVVWRQHFNHRGLRSMPISFGRATVP